MESGTKSGTGRDQLLSRDGTGRDKLLKKPIRDGTGTKSGPGCSTLAKVEQNVFLKFKIYCTVAAGVYVHTTCSKIITIN